MTTGKVLEIVLREMMEYAHAWRGDWSDFDGRSLLWQMEGIKSWAEKALTDNKESDYKEGGNFHEEHIKY